LFLQSDSGTLELIRIANYPDQLGPSGKFVDNSTKLTCLEITGYRINYSSVLASRTSNQAPSKGLGAGFFFFLSLAL
jgi:hypothetical protein